MGEIIIKPRVLKSGKTVYEYAFEIASVDGKRKRKTKSGFKTKKEAREAGKIAQQIYESVGQVIEPSDMSFSDFLDNWIEYDCRLSCKDITVKGYEKKIRLYIKPALGHYKVKSITKDILQKFIVDMFDNGFSINTISSVKGILSKTFEYGVDRHYILYSPAIKLKIPKNMQPKKQTRQEPHVYISSDKINKIFERFPEGSVAHIPLMLGYHCGLRLGEIYALTWDDIDFKNKTLSVNRQVQWYQAERSKESKKKTNGTSESGGGFWYFSEPKCKSYRIIDIDNTLTDLLKREKIKQEKAMTYYDEHYTRYYVEHELIFDGCKPNFNVLPMNEITQLQTNNEIHFICRREDGTYISPRTSQHTSSVIHHQLKFPEYDTHSLRHTHATMLIENGADMIYVQRRLGHVNQLTTANIYTNHLTDTIRERGKILLNNIY